MTATHLDALLAAADLSDAEERLMLADAYEEAGLPDDAAALRGRGEFADRLAHPPCWSVQVRQTTGYTEPDEFGRTMNYERELTLCTDFADHIGGASSRREWEILHPAERLWWYVALSDLHDARYELASAGPECREYVEANLTAGGELEHAACEIRELIAEFDAAPEAQ